jgi:quercetin dioxygenase-like cupin family protein
MRSIENLVPNSQQNTDDIEGYYFEANNGHQIAYWTCKRDRTSKKHMHDFDEYVLCVSGQYTAYVNQTAYILNAGDELVIPKGMEQWSSCIAGTRTIHMFAGSRIKTSSHSKLVD